MFIMSGHKHKSKSQKMAIMSNLFSTVPDTGTDTNTDIQLNDFLNFSNKDREITET